MTNTNVPECNHLEDVYFFVYFSGASPCEVHESGRRYPGGIESTRNRHRVASDIFQSFCCDVTMCSYDVTLFQSHIVAAID